MTAGRTGNKLLYLNFCVVLFELTQKMKIFSHLSAFYRTKASVDQQQMQKQQGNKTHMRK